MRPELEEKSKFLSLLLRHKPQVAGIKLDDNGWANVSQILTNTNITLNELIEIVDTNDKKRFAVDDDWKKIRASQGHTLKVDLKLKRANPPEILYHGTQTKNLESIKKKGLDKGNRNHVHLSDNIDTAKTVAGRRKGQNVLFEIKAWHMTQDGHAFFKSENGVWLIEHVPSKYLTYKYF